MRYCKKCVLPSTKPGLTIAEDGVCSACKSVQAKKNIDWRRRYVLLKEFCESIKGKNEYGYDCLVPISGGKDSTYQLYCMKFVYGLNPLAVTIDAHIKTPEGIQNLNKSVSSLGVDLIRVNVRPNTLAKIRREAFLKIGNPNYGEHRVVFSAVARTALSYNIPLVVWGEDIGVEFGGNVSKSSIDSGSAEDLINNDLFREIAFDDLIEGQVDENTLFFYDHPEKSLLAENNIKSIYLGFYQWWDGFKHLQVAKNFGFKGRLAGPLSGNIINYDNIDERLCEVHNWLKMLKFGFWRPHDEASYLIVNNYITREEAVERVNKVKYDFPFEYFNDFLEYHQLNEYQFWEVAERYRNKDLWKKINGNWRLIYELM